MTSESKKTSGASPEPYNAAKRQCFQLVCAHCKLNIDTTSRIPCTKCNKLFHGKRSCSGLTVLDFKNDSITKNYICNECKESDQLDVNMSEINDDEPDPKVLKMVLMKILTELRISNAKIDDLRKDYLELKQENGELKTLMSKKFNQIMKTTSYSKPNEQFIPSPSDDSGRSRSTKRSNSRTRPGERKRSRSTSIKWRIPIARNKETKMVSNVSNVDKRNRDGRGSKNVKSFQVSRTVEEYQSDDVKRRTMASLPISKVKHCKINLLLTVYDCEADSKAILTHLKKQNFEIYKVSRITTRGDNYRCFVIECSDLEFEEIIDSPYWHPNTRLTIFKSKLNQERVLESHPKN